MGNREKDIKALRQLFADLSDAWNKGDGIAFGECFTEDADYITFMGQHLKGRKSIAEVHQWLFDGPLKGSRLTGGESSIELQPRFITPTVAIIHGVGVVALSDSEQDSTDRESINTNVVVKQSGEWKITAFHNCRIQEMPGRTR
ncbi:conserved hypothetical protein [Seinonella peptonophila]|uniref:DUF4440 domain-containing protein n=1 Tax=Seinonella peptonophila TaxID=112248 RepID=A0A1M5A4N7_9BACL|nr:SgcJ/EcaC family oxidoreductase [Seinonella peptonophila]SHF25175.1 conserved hypothetical protein [Seinonella peptonophila]